MNTLKALLKEDGGRRAWKGAGSTPKQGEEYFGQVEDVPEPGPMDFPRVCDMIVKENMIWHWRL